MGVIILLSDHIRNLVVGLDFTFFRRMQKEQCLQSYMSSAGAYEGWLKECFSVVDHYNSCLQPHSINDVSLFIEIYLII